MKRLSKSNTCFVFTDVRGAFFYGSTVLKLRHRTSAWEAIDANFGTARPSLRS